MGRFVRGSFREFKSQLLYLGTSKNLSKIFNFGFLLAVCLGSQIVRGLFLAILYIRGRDFRFSELFLIIENTINGRLIRYVHIIGVSFLLLLIAIAFIGYVLPNNQISF